MHKIKEIPVFYPNLEEMRNFSKYVEMMEMNGATEFGIAKVCHWPGF